MMDAVTYWVEEVVGGKKVLRKTPPEQAFLIGSLTANGNHIPLFDLDFPVVWKDHRVEFQISVDAPRWWQVVDQFADARLVSGASVGPVGILTNPYMEFSVPYKVYPSSTAGHFHLVLEKEVPWILYRDILRAMRWARLIGEKYLALSEEARMGMLIKPPLTKQDISSRSGSCGDGGGFGSGGYDGGGGWGS
jgi:uncharacterized membrane protein YgcG